MLVSYMGVTAIEQVIVNDTVSVIGNSAFDGCTNLVSVTLPNGLGIIALGLSAGAPLLHR